MLATKRLAGVAPEVNLKEHVTHMPLPSANKAAHSGFETQRRCIIGPTKRTHVLQKFLKKHEFGIYICQLNQCYFICKKKPNEYETTIVLFKEPAYLQEQHVTLNRTSPALLINASCGLKRNLGYFTLGCTRPPLKPFSNYLFHKCHQSIFR